MKHSVIPSCVLLSAPSTPLGRALCHALLTAPSLEDRVSVLAVDKLPQGLTGLPEHPRLRYERVEFSRPRALRDLLFGIAVEANVQAVIHGPLHRDMLGTGPQLHREDVESTRELLHLLEHHPTIKRLVFRSVSAVYQVAYERSDLLDEQQPLELSPSAPQWVRDRVEADLIACTHMGLSPLSIAVMRLAELLAPDCGSQLYDWLQTRVCLRPLGFDPMIEVLSIPDAVEALLAAVCSTAQGVFNVPGADVLPLSKLAEKSDRTAFALPGPMLAPLYLLRRRTQRLRFRYEANETRFHKSGVLDGSRARTELGYEPTHPIDWNELKSTLP